MIKVFYKADEILSEVSEKEGVTFNSLMKKTGMARSTLFQILKTMMELGWISRDAEGAFSPGENLINYARKTLDSQSLVLALSEAVRFLAETTGQTSTAAIVMDDKRLGVAKAYGKDEIVADNGRLDRSPVGFFSTATGKVLAAFQSKRKRSQLIESSGLECPAELISELDRIKMDGLSMHESSGGVVSIASGVFSRGGEIKAAIGLAAPAYGLTPEKKKLYIAKIREAAMFVEKMLET